MADYNVIQMKNKAGAALFPKTKINLVEGAEAFVNGLIANQIHMNVAVVDALPAEGVAGKIYLVAKKGEAGNVHNEYLWINGKWELIGDTAVSLTGYATESFVNTAISNKVTELNLAQYAKAADLTALDGRVATVEDKVDTWDGYAGQISAIEGRVNTLEGEMATVQEFVEGADDAYAAKSYEQTVDDHIADTVKHITAEERTAWNGKQAALTEAQLAAVNSGITEELVGKITANETAISNVYTKTEADDKFETIENVNAVKEDIAKNAADIKTINESDVMTSGITSTKVTAYDNYATSKADSKVVVDNTELFVLYYEDLGTFSEPDAE